MILLLALLVQARIQLQTFNNGDNENGADDEERKTCIKRDTNPNPIGHGP